MRLIVLAALLSASFAFANEVFFSTQVVDAVAVPALPQTTSDAAWGSITGKAFTLAPQRTVRFHDKAANDVLKVPANTEALVRAAQKGDELAVLVEWADESAEVVREDEVNVYADSIALQTPVSVATGSRLPAISMGDADAPVHVTLQRATKEGALVSSLLAAGFGSSTRQGPAEQKKGTLTYDSAAKKWRALFAVSVKDVKTGLAPMALAIWEAGRLERAGNKRLSSWKFVRLAGKQLDAEFVKQVSWGFAPGDLGDPEKGRVLAEAVCASCHHMPGRTHAPAGIAPSLGDVGAIALPMYLRDSIITPSQVVLYNPNPNQHYDTSGTRDRFGAFPNNDGFAWFTVGADGKRTSKMPPFSGFSAEQIGDLVAFLRSLDGKGPPP